MLAFAVAVVLFAYAERGLRPERQAAARARSSTAAAFAGLMLVAHLAVRRLAPWADPLLLPLAALLNGLGIVMIYRLQEAGRGGNPGRRSSARCPRTRPPTR